MSLPIPEASTPLLPLFRDMGIHPMIGLKMFVKNVELDEDRFNLRDVPFMGHAVKIYRMGSNNNITSWRISPEMKLRVHSIFRRLNSATKKWLRTKTAELYSLEEASATDTDMQLSRFLLGMHDKQTVRIRAMISDYCMIQCEHASRLRVSFRNLQDPSTDAVYADHTHVLLRDEQVGFFMKLPVGTCLEFDATVHSYNAEDTDMKKYGIHNLQQVQVVTCTTH